MILHVSRYNIQYLALGSLAYEATLRTAGTDEPSNSSLWNGKDLKLLTQIFLHPWMLLKGQEKG